MGHMGEERLGPPCPRSLLAVPRSHTATGSRPGTSQSRETRPTQPRAPGGLVARRPSLPPSPPPLPSPPAPRPTASCPPVLSLCLLPSLQPPVCLLAQCLGPAMPSCPRAGQLCRESLSHQATSLCCREEPGPSWPTAQRCSRAVALSRPGVWAGVRWLLRLWQPLMPRDAGRAWGQHCALPLGPHEGHGANFSR